MCSIYCDLIVSIVCRPPIRIFSAIHALALRAVGDCQGTLRTVEGLLRVVEGVKMHLPSLCSDLNFQVPDALQKNVLFAASGYEHHRCRSGVQSDDKGSEAPSTSIWSQRLWVRFPRAVVTSLTIGAGWSD